MPLTQSQDQIRAAIRFASESVKLTDRTTDADIDTLMNLALGRFHQKAIITNPEFVPIASQLWTFDGDSTVQNLPVLYRATISMEYTHVGAQKKRFLLPFELFERPMLSDVDAITNSHGASAYRRFGSQMEFLPRPKKGDTALMWYATTAPQLSQDAQNIDTFDRMIDQFVIWHAAREICGNLGMWERHSSLNEKLMELQSDIGVLVRTRDISGPRRVTDLQHADRFGRRIRYR